MAAKSSTFNGVHIDEARIDEFLTGIQQNRRRNKKATRKGLIIAAAVLAYQKAGGR